jgi:hypothetical protein
MDTITVTPSGDGWAVKHNDGFLGKTRSQSEAEAVAQNLVAWLRNEGRSGTLRVVDTIRFDGDAQRTAGPGQTCRPTPTP